MNTSGHWYTKNKPHDAQGLVIEESTGRTVAVTYDPKDAPLVAAAPQLAEAATELLNAHMAVLQANMNGTLSMQVEANKREVAARDALRAVLAEIG